MIQIGMEIGTSVNEFCCIFLTNTFVNGSFFLSQFWLKCSAEYCPGMAEISVAYILFGHKSQIHYLYVRFNLLAVSFVSPDFLIF